MLEKKHILIIDDFETNIKYLKSLLLKDNFEVSSSKNVDEALNQIRKTHFNLILLDVVMPEMDGFGLCTLIRKNKLNCDTPVIFITTRDDEESVMKGFEVGGQDFVTRPFREKELLARVNTQIELVDKRSKLEMINNNLGKIVQERTMELHDTLTKLSASYDELKEAKKEIEELDLAKENFLQIISHEIRTPLNGIMGFSVLLSDMLKESEYHAYLTMLIESVKRLESFSIRALLITELKTRKYPIDIYKIALAEEIEKVLDLQEVEISAKQIKIQRQIADSVLLADRKLLNQILRSIIENSVSYAPTIGTIKINGYNVDNYKYHLEVIDNGAGFPETCLNSKNKLFAKENFIDSNPGMGLYSADLMIKALGGSMSLHNEKEGGAKVILQFNRVRDNSESRCTSDLDKGTRINFH